MKPILFNTPMVQAILDERKTQTRRALKKPFEIHPNGYITKPHKHERLHPYKAHYQKGDILYVRETFVLNYFNSEGDRTSEVQEIMYRADGNNIDWVDDNDCETNTPWKPSIHMPKEYARIFLKVTDVRVERLNDISMRDSMLEGYDEKAINNPFIWFRYLWNSTSKDGYKWEDSPYVFVYEFERVEKPAT